MTTIAKLESLIKKHKELYYAGKAEISDEEFDSLEEKLKLIDPNNYVLSLVGSSIKSSHKVKHETKMLSLNKTYDIDDLKSWIKENDVVSVVKIDGSSCSLIYDNGKLVMAKTRGDGTYGEDITAKAFWINDIPKTISTKEKVEIRGEIFCTEKKFFFLSQEMEKSKLEKPSSQRNIVAGLIGRKDHIRLSKYLSFNAFELIGVDGLKTETEKLKELKKLGLRLPPYHLHSGPTGIMKSINEAQTLMSKGDFLIDGLVFTYDNLEYHKQMGATSHHPKYKIAFKFAGETAIAKIEEIIWSVSRNGILTPVANIQETELSGAKISRVTLHNYGMVKQFNLKANDEIEIIRSGEVIPKFLSVKYSSDSKLEIPRKCPVCQHDTKKESIRLFCMNEFCSGRKKEEFLNFIKKIGIDDLSEKRLEEMLGSGLIESLPDLYKLSKDQLLTLDKTKEKLATKLYRNIQATKQTELVKFLSALGITGGAVNKCEKIVNAGHDTIEKVLALTVDELVQIDSFAIKSATDFMASLSQKKQLILDLLKAGFIVESAVLKKSSQILEGKKFCITGTLSLKRNDIIKIIKDNGGQVVSSVTSNTDYLVTNDTESSSSKFVKAEKLSIPIINEDKLFKLIK